VQHPYSTGDIRLGIDTPGWTAAVFVNNLWDERGQDFFSNRWATQRLTLNQPRTFGITFRKYFK
jgi:outer membrane receptor protein involved in Fe transport